jgi:hypothetical protein
MTLATVDWDALETAIWVSVVAGVGVTTAYGLAIVGATRAIELRRSGHGAGATVYGALGLLAAATVLAAIAYGIVILSR